MMQKKYFIIILTLIFISSGISLPRNFGSKKQIILRIEKGEGFRDVAVNLQEEGLIWWGPFFQLYAIASGKAHKLQAGSYSLSPSMNIPQIAKKLFSGDIAKVKITVPEGFTSAQIAEKLKNISDPDPIILAKYEGYLFPDTYEISYGMGEEQIIQIMTDNFSRKTANLKITPEIITMASILEKEVKTKEEKELAAGVLWKRLKAVIPLQVDVYMWTYENYGLPPKPISNPGLESILASLYPKESAYWYYLSTPEGNTIFSRTLEEHNIAKAKYLSY